jgi:FtsZ-binding cell division protein ZapB
MQLPGLDRLEASVARAVEKLGATQAENAELKERLLALGKEIDSLAAQVGEIGSGQKVDLKARKRLEQKLKTILDKLA